MDYAMAGRLTQDPEVKYMQNGGRLVNIRVAEKGGEGEYYMTAFEPAASMLAPLMAGDEVQLAGYGKYKPSFKDPSKSYLNWYVKVAVPMGEALNRQESAGDAPAAPGEQIADPFADPFADQ
jgi:hypothetical protein